MRTFSTIGKGNNNQHHLEKREKYKQNKDERWEKKGNLRTVVKRMTPIAGTETCGRKRKISVSVLPQILPLKYC